jgi:hypothetical protein
VFDSRLAGQHLTYDSSRPLLACATMLPRGQLSSVHRSRRNTTYCRMTSSDRAPPPPLAVCSSNWAGSAEAAAATEAGDAADTLPLISPRRACRSCRVLHRHTAGLASVRKADLQDLRRLQQLGMAAVRGWRGCGGITGASAPQRRTNSEAVQALRIDRNSAAAFARDAAGIGSPVGVCNVRRRVGRCAVRRS